MRRRQFFGQVAAAGATLSAAAAALDASAQAKPTEGLQYLRLSRPVAVAGGGKIDVVEFFSYECQFCNALEPSIEPWIRSLPADVGFRRVQVPFLPNHDNFQKLYCSLEALGAVEALHEKLFKAVHVDHLRLDSLPEITAFVVKYGVDSARFQSTFNSFGVQTRAKQANQWTRAYAIEGVPSIGVQGRFIASGQGGASGAAMLPVVDFLIQRVRSEG